VFTSGSSEKFRIAPNEIQIDTTDFRPQHHVKSALSATHFAVNRTAVKQLILCNAAAKTEVTLRQLPGRYT
jgi:hypothetical protein